MRSIRARIGVMTALVVVLIAPTACEGSSLGEEPEPDALTIGLLVPQSGPYKAIGDDMRRGWDLYLDQHGGKLGGHPIDVVTVDEADGGAAARAGVDKLIKQDRVVAIVGTATAPAVSTVVGPVNEAKIPFVGVGGRPTTLSDLRYVWHTSFLSTDYGQAIAAHVRAAVDGPVYVIGPDYQGGKDQIESFVQAFTAAGGKLANPNGRATYTPWPATDNFGPWLSKIPATGAAAVYAFYAGAPAVSFVKQYEQFGLKSSLPLYAAGFLTEGAALAAEGAAADGIFTVMPYAPGLDNPTNEVFAAALQAKHHAVPNLYHVTSYDAAAVLDRAIGAAGDDPTPEAINTAIGQLGPIDSPRGAWQFGPVNHSPVQAWYLRRVATDGATRDNVVVKELATIGS
jgi:branched-chain amino acid transport system substrate-binding protein